MTEKLVSARFGPGPFSMTGIAQLIRSLGDVEGDDLRPLAAKLAVPEDSFHIKAAADLLGISEEPRELPELYATVRRLLQAEAPITIVFDEVGAAGPAFFNLLGYLEEILADEPVIIELRGEPDTDYPMIGSTERLMSDGMRALQRSDMPAADAFLAAAADALPPGDDRSECLAARCDALLATGRGDQALEVAESGRRAARSEANERYQARFSFFTTLLGHGSDDLGRDLDPIASILVRAGDHVGAAQALEAIAHFTSETGAASAAFELMNEALGHARRAGDRQITTRVVAWMCEAISEGALDGEGSRKQIEDLSWVSTFSPLVETKRLTTLARLEARAGSPSSARSLVARAATLQEDLGQPPWIAGIPQAIEEIERVEETRTGR